MDTVLWKRYWYRALLAAWLLRLVPFVRLVGLNGSMVTGKLRPESDIDFLIITAQNRLYLTRFLSAAILSLAGLKLRSANPAGKICLNRYATEDFLTITPQDLYHAQVFHNLVPLASSQGLYERFYDANQWMTNLGFAPIRHPIVLKPGLATIWQKIWELLLLPFASFLELGCQFWQKQKLNKDPRRLNDKSIIVMTNQELRIHFAKDDHARS